MLQMAHSPAAEGHLKHVDISDVQLVSCSQTLFFAQGRYRFQYKRPARKGSGPVYSSDSFWHHHGGGGC